MDPTQQLLEYIDSLMREVGAGDRAGHLSLFLKSDKPQDLVPFEPTSSEFLIHSSGVAKLFEDLSPDREELRSEIRQRLREAQSEMLERLKGLKETGALPPDDTPVRPESLVHNVQLPVDRIRPSDPSTPAAPAFDHNLPERVRRLEERVDAVRTGIQRLRHSVEQGSQGATVHDTVASLGYNAALLDASIRECTVRYDFIDEDGERVLTTYETPVSFVEGQLDSDPSLMLTPVPHDQGIYQDLGFTRQEYDDLLALREELLKEGANVSGAYDEFATRVIADLQAARYTVLISEIAPGLVGMVGIGADVLSFSATANVPMLVSSLTTGLTAICATFPTVRAKLHKGFY